MDLFTLGSGLGALTAVTGAVWLGWRRSAPLRQRVGSAWGQFEKGLIVLNGRSAVTLPENPAVEVAPEIPGVLDRMESVEQGQGAVVLHVGKLQRDVEYLLGEVHEIKGEVTHNHGTSLKDAVRRIERSVDRNTDHLARSDDRFQQIEECLSTLADAQPR